MYYLLLTACFVEQYAINVYLNQHFTFINNTENEHYY